MLNVGFGSYGVSSIALLVIGFMAENSKMSAVKMGVFYFLAGVIGNLFSVCVDF